MTIGEHIERRVQKLNLKRLTKAQKEWLHFVNWLATLNMIARVRKARPFVLCLSMLVLQGCGQNFREFYGVKSFGEFFEKSSCMQVYGMTCDDYDRVQGLDSAHRAAIRRAIKESRR